MEAINVLDKYKLFTKQWHPHIIAEGQNLMVYLSKLQGEFIMHKHNESDEIFYVVRGKLEILFTDHSTLVKEGEILLVPRGTEHCPRTISGEEVYVMMILQAGTTHTGNVECERTVKKYTRL